MDTPGYDPVGATGQVAGGANLLCFTTGRGSVFGCKPAPSHQARHQHADVRAHGGRHGHQLRHHPDRRGERAAVRRSASSSTMLRTASGEQTKSEQFDFGAAEFAPWVLGATM